VTDEFHAMGPRVSGLEPRGVADSMSEEVDVVVDDEDDTAVPTPPIPPVKQDSRPERHEAPPERASARPSAPSPAASSASSLDGASKRPRPRMTLRIPDDEVSRPASVTPPDPDPPRPEIAPARIITINPPSSRDAIDDPPSTQRTWIASDEYPAPDLTARDAPEDADTALSLDAIDSDVVIPVSADLSDEDSPEAHVDRLDALAPSPERAERPEENARMVSRPAMTPAPAPAAAQLPSIPPPPLAARLATPPPARVQLEPAPAAAPFEAELPEVDAEPDVDGLDIPVDEDDELASPEIGPDDVVSVESMPSASSGRASSPPFGMQSTPSLAGGAPVGAATPRGGVPVAVVAPASASASKSPLLIVPPLASPLAPPPMNDSAASRKRARPWWEELFNDDFIRTMAKVTDEQIAGECDFIEDSLGVAKGAMVLDLGCGTGRHAIELTARGYQVVGYDLSLAMLARAADEAQDRNQKLNFLQGDMREMTFEDTFDGVYSWNTSFGFFEEEKNAAVVSRVHKSLRKGGQFLLDVVNRDYIMRQAPSLAWFEGDGCICMDEMSIDWITSRMKVKRTMMMDDGRSKEIEYSIRVYSLHELGKVLHDHGFRVAEVSGRTATPGVFFGADSPRTLILAEKR